MSILIGDNMTVNWDNITVTDNSPEIPDFALEFELHDGWDSENRGTSTLVSTQVPDSERLKYDETDGEDDDIFLDDSGDFEYNGEDDDDWIDPTDDDLIAIENGEITWIN